MLDSSGHLIGIVSYKLTGVDGVGFAVGAAVIKTVLEHNAVSYRAQPSDDQLFTTDIVALGRRVTVPVDCTRAAPPATPRTFPVRRFPPTFSMRYQNTLPN